jgi:hypothetical protein
MVALLPPDCDEVGAGGGGWTTPADRWVVAGLMRRATISAGRKKKRPKK